MQIQVGACEWRVLLNLGFFILENLCPEVDSLSTDYNRTRLIQKPEYPL